MKVSKEYKNSSMKSALETNDTACEQKQRKDNDQKEQNFTCFSLEDELLYDPRDGATFELNLKICVTAC